MFGEDILSITGGGQGLYHSSPVTMKKKTSWAVHIYRRCSQNSSTLLIKNRRCSCFQPHIPHVKMLPSFVLKSWRKSGNSPLKKKSWKSLKKSWKKSLKVLEFRSPKYVATLKEQKKTHINLHITYKYVI